MTSAGVGGCATWLGGVAELMRPTTTATASDAAAAAGAARRSQRRAGMLLRRGGGVAAMRATRSRRALGADGVSARRAVARSGDKAWPHFLLQPLERTVEPRRACGRRDSEYAPGGLGVELEDDAQRDHLAVGGSKRA